MSKYKLQFKLKQHTPIIHFQHNQHGATLRATELKPKLDRFLIEKFKAENFKYSNFLIDGQEKALDYKVKIKPNVENDFFLPYNIYLNNNKTNTVIEYISDKLNIAVTIIAPCPYFGNADKLKLNGNYINHENSKPNEILIATQTKEDLEINIICFKEVLLLEIEKSIVEFFILNNFGTRQNKGFGSFTVKSLNETEINKTDTLKIISNYFIKKSNKQNSLINVFSFINTEYQLLKSGINFNGYKKSELFKYFIDNNIRWEKRFIKQKLNANGVQLTQQNHNEYKPIDYDILQSEYYNEYTDKQNNTYKYVRALLGLGEHIEFATNNRGRLNVKIKHLPENGNEKIERFKSPIFFKVIDNNVYLKTDETYKSILGETFNFSEGNNDLGNLSIPSTFNINDFIKKHISNQWSNL